MFFFGVDCGCAQFIDRGLGVVVIILVYVQEGLDRDGFVGLVEECDSKLVFVSVRVFICLNHYWVDWESGWCRCC